MFRGDCVHTRRRVYAALLATYFLLGVAGCALFAFCAGRRAKRAQESFRQLFDVLALQVADLELPGNLRGLREWAEGMGALPRVALLAVYDEHDNLLAVGGGKGKVRKALIDFWVRRPPSAWGTTTVRLAGRRPVELPYRSERVACTTDSPRYLGLLLVGAEDSDLSPVLPTQAWKTFYLPLVGAGGLALLGGLVCVDRWALGPLGRFLAVARRAREAQNPPEAETGPETVEGLLASVEALLDQSKAWREEARQLSMTFDRRVDAMNRYITRELRNAFKQAATDPLTGLGNRRVLDENLSDLIAQSARADEDLSVLLVDLDHFKTINDRYGHAHGDKILRFVGELLSACLREDDIAVRMGGDEFALLLPGVGPKDARKIALRLTALCKQRRCGSELRHPLSMSVGVVSLKDFPTRDPREFLEMADRALYAAKEAGRDGVVVLSTGVLSRVVAQ
jgi:diguanylate cyclase (GGDEF)-like protein